MLDIIKNSAKLFTDSGGNIYLISIRHQLLLVAKACLKFRFYFCQREGFSFGNIFIGLFNGGQILLINFEHHSG